MKKVVIMRGPSGAGKSTYIKKNFSGAVVVSADQFFEKVDAEGNLFYDFDIEKLGEAHANCQLRFVEHLQGRVDCIVVDNTHIHKWEYAGYKAIAKLAGYEVKIIEFCPTMIHEIKTCITRNAHRVPADIVARMCVEFEPDENAESLWL